MKLEIARPEDSEELKSFYSSFPVRGPIDFQIQRTGSYFDQYRLQTEDFTTYCLREKDGSLQGTATMLFRPAKIDGETETIGYATDLRISSNRKAIVKWTEHFLPLLEENLKARNARFLFSVISNMNSVIQNTLVRPRAQRRQIPVYHLLRKFDIVTIVGHWPLIYDRLDSVRITRATLEDLPALAELLSTQLTHRPLAFDYSIELLQYRFKRWPGLRIDSFIIAKDKQGRIVGCCAPWSNRGVQTTTPIQYHGFAESARTALKVGSLFKLTTPPPAKGQPVEIEYITHLAAKNPDVFGVLLEEAYRSKAPGAILTYAHFHSYPMTLPPKQFYCSRTQSSIYAVTMSEQKLPASLEYSSLDRPPELELALI